MTEEAGTSTCNDDQMQWRKRKRLDQLLDRIAHQATLSRENSDEDFNESTEEVQVRIEPRLDETFQQHRITGQVFRFDSADKERLLRNTISEEEEGLPLKTEYDDEDNVFSPSFVSERSPLSSTGTADSPHIAFSPLRIHEEDEPRAPRLVLPQSCSCLQCRQKISDLSGSPSHCFEYLIQSQYAADLSRRRALSDSDLSVWLENVPYPQPLSVCRNKLRRRQRPRPLISKVGSVDSDKSSPGFQDSPLDLSVRRSTGSTASSSSSDSPLTGFNHGLSPGLSPLTNSPSPSSLSAFHFGRLSSPLSPSVATLRAPSPRLQVPEEIREEACYVCPSCGQIFNLQDRLAKHIASRHKSKPRVFEAPNTSRAYSCEICKRAFARSDMLTRHMRLHTGLKPYTCRTCGQVFSRSDHLSTHQRTHTGEKPYRCPSCPYAACRRDMITRHMRTHLKGEVTTPMTSEVEGQSKSRMKRNRFRDLMRSQSAEEVPPGSPALNITGLTVRSPIPPEMETGES